MFSGPDSMGFRKAEWDKRLRSFCNFQLSCHVVFLWSSDPVAPLLSRGIEDAMAIHQC